MDYGTGFSGMLLAPTGGAVGRPQREVAAAHGAAEEIAAVVPEAQEAESADLSLALAALSHDHAGNHPEVAHPEEAAEREAAAPAEVLVQHTGGMFDVPRSECPGKPSKKSLGQGAPPKKVLGAVQTLLKQMVDGEVPYRGSMWNLTCVFVTKECADPATTHGLRVMKKMGLNEAKIEQVRQNMPDFTEGSLGTCAIVANSDNLLKAQRGTEIDAHDTVLRHNTPLKGFAKNVGTKSSIIFVKSNYRQGGKGGLKASDGVGSGMADLAYATLQDVSQAPKNFKSNGRPLFLRGGGAIPLARLRRELYKVSGQPRSKHPSGGFARPFNLLASRLCTRVDLYGFSGDMGGKYFAKATKVRDAHSMGFEHWAYRYLQSQGRLCVYGD